MRNTEPPPPLSERSSESVLEELCFALRDVGVHDGQRPLSERGVAAILRVQQADAELARRGLESAARIAQLSEETGWQMQQLLADCHGYPARRPRLRDLDGIRTALRCYGCRKRERPEADEWFFLCDDCLTRVAGHLQARTAAPDIFVFRTYTAEAWCRHADAETVLAVYPWNEEEESLGRRFCALCIEEELWRRASAAPDPAGREPEGDAR